MKFNLKITIFLVGLAIFCSAILYAILIFKEQSEVNSQIKTQAEMTEILSDFGKENEEFVASLNWNLWALENQKTEIINKNSQLKEEILVAIEQKQSDLLKAKNELLELNKAATELGLKVNAKCENCDQPKDADLFIQAKKVLVLEKELEQKKVNLNQEILAEVGNLEEKNSFKNSLWGKTEIQIREIISKMTNQEKAGQLLMFGFNGSELNDKLKTDLQNWQAGGLILMGSNIKNAQQVERLIDGIEETNEQIPYFVAVDQEGGVVKRIAWDSVAGQENWSKIEDETLCNYGLERGKILRQLGFNLNFSPVADLSNPGEAFINDRTVSADPNIVAQKLQPYIRCHQNSGVFTTIKHFPGHGSTIQDSHFKLPLISKSESDWRKQDLLPFEKNLNAEFVMAGHLVYSTIDDKPATQSHKLLTKILREELKFEGLIITDDMNQLHVSSQITVKDALKNAYVAGVNIVLYVGLPMNQVEIKNELVNLIESGEFPQEKVDESLLRILKVKRRIGIN